MWGEHSSLATEAKSWVQHRVDHKEQPEQKSRDPPRTALHMSMSCSHSLQPIPSPWLHLGAARHARARKGLAEFVHGPRGAGHGKRAGGPFL